MVTLLENKGFVIFEAEEYKMTQDKLKKIEYLEKRNWWFFYSDGIPWKDDYAKYSLDQLKDILSAIKELSKETPIGSVAGDNTPADRTAELKEDIREMIFQKRRDGKKLKGNLYSFKDLST